MRCYDDGLEVAHAWLVRCYGDGLEMAHNHLFDSHFEIIEHRYTYYAESPLPSSDAALLKPCLTSC